MFVVGSLSIRFSAVLAFCSHAAKSVALAGTGLTTAFDTDGAGFPNTCPSPPKA